MDLTKEEIGIILDLIRDKYGHLLDPLQPPILNRLSSKLLARETILQESKLESKEI